MSIEMYLCNANSECSMLLAGLPQSAEWLIWMRVQKRHEIQETAVANLMSSFGDLRGIIWSTGLGGQRTKRIADHFRALGNLPTLSHEVVANDTVHMIPQDETIYSDIAWFSPTSTKDLSIWLNSSIRRNMLGISDHISFIPNNTEAVQKWAKVVYGLNWLYLCKEWLATEANSPLQTTPIILNYLRLTTEKINGIPALAYEDVDSNNGLVFFGQQTAMERVFEKLTEFFKPLSSAEFQSWVRRGVYLCLAP